MFSGYTMTGAVHHSYAAPTSSKILTGLLEQNITVSELLLKTQVV